MSITQQEFPIKEKRSGVNNNIYIATEKIYDGYEIQRQVMNVRNSPKEFNFRSTFLQSAS